MPKSLYLINPKSDTPSYFGAEAFESWGFQPTQGIADLATVTVAAMAPPDWTVTVCDEFVQPVDFDIDADFVGLTGKFNQRRRMIAIAEEFRRCGKTVIIGGPFASLSPKHVRGHCDILVVGEMESIAEQFFADLESSSWQPEYDGTDKPDLGSSPVPRWDLYPNERTLSGCVQTSRGCPFECEFCDVIQYLGRTQRHKSVEQILAELDVLYAHRYRLVFLADDNFTVYRRRAKEVLSAIRDWNARRTDGPVAFGTQVSIDAARDPEIMRLCAEAGMIWVFIGIETPNQESLQETRKRQNVGIDLQQQIQVFLDHGISVIGGMIVGFDHDGPGIFQLQYDFAVASPIPIFSLGALEAPEQTPLYARLEQSGRLRDEHGSASTPWSTNIVPVGMTREQQQEGLQWLCNRLYQPAAFGQRMVQMIERMGPQQGPFALDRRQFPSSPRALDGESLNLLRKFIGLGAEERRMYAAISKALAANPEAGPMMALMLFRYAQVRCLYETGAFWDPHVQEASPFRATAASGPATGSGLVQLG